MSLIQRTARVAYSSRQMFDLVNDVERYPQFITGCTAARVARSGPSEMLATLTIAKGLLETQLVTRNSWEDGAWIHMSLIEGPLHSLEGRWSFKELGPAGTRVDFLMNFELSSALLGAALRPTVETMLQSMVEAFVRRARKVYG